MHQAVKVLLVVLLLTGCASMSPVEKAYVFGGVADGVLTGLAMEQGNEGNPILTAGGTDTAQVLASMALFKWAAWKLMRGNDLALGAAAGIQFAAAGHNLSVIEKGSNP